MSEFLSERFSALEEYVPGEQPQNMKYIKLNTNESPFAPSPSVIEKINKAEIEDLRLYPDPDCKKMKAKLAQAYGVSDENVFISNGSDEILSFAFMSFCDKKTGVAFPNISYGFYKVYADLYGIDKTIIPLDEKFGLNYKDYCGINKTVVIANPNAPTGLIIPVCEIEEILKSNPHNVVLIDEAYIDFGGQSCYRLIDKYKNLLVCRTYSKSRSMAGARLGFALASKEIIADLNKIKYSTNPYNINRLSLVAGEAAIDDDEYYKNKCNEIIKNREYTKEKLLKYGFECTDSKANFLFAKSDKIKSEQLYCELKKRGILVRYFANAGRVSEYLRITVGTREQMDALLERINEILDGIGE